MCFSREEYTRRMERIQESIAGNGLDVLLVSSEESLFYLTGAACVTLGRPFFLIIRQEGPATLLVPHLERKHLSQLINAGRIYTYRDYPAPPGEGWSEKLLTLLSGTGTLGVEPTLPYEIAEKLTSFSMKVLPLVEKARLIKSEEEVKAIRQAAGYAGRAVASVLKTAYYGVSELELFTQARSLQTSIMRDNEYDVLNSDILTGAWPAPKNARPHSIPSMHERLKQGPHIAMARTRINGYAAECERTFFMGNPVKEAKEAFKAIHHARKLAFSMVMPGVKCGEIDAVVNEFLIGEGFRDNLLHRTGHGFGLSAQEGPWLAEGDDTVLERNMFISIEPGIYMEGIGGVRHSDTVLVTGEGYELLTRYPTDMDSLVIKSLKPFQRIKGCAIRKFMHVR